MLGLLVRAWVLVGVYWRKGGRIVEAGEVTSRARVAPWPPEERRLVRVSWVEGRWWEVREMNMLWAGRAWRFVRRGCLGAWGGVGIPRFALVMSA